MSQLSDLCASLGITIESEQRTILTEEERGSWTENSSHWAVRLYFEGRSFVTLYHMGAALSSPPDVADVLYCLLSDSSSGEGSFADMCQDFGLSEDSRSARRIWKACRRVSKQLPGFCGEHFDALRNADH